MQGVADVGVLDLLVEDEGDAVGLLAVLLGEDERVRLGHAVRDLLLGAETQPLGQEESTEPLMIEISPGGRMRKVRQMTEQ